MIPKIFRASPSIITSWIDGYKDDAVSMYFGLDRTESPAMIEGRKWHKQWQQWVLQHQTVPREFITAPGDSEWLKKYGDIKLVNPKTELKLEAMLNPWLKLVGVIDRHTDNFDGWINDYKTGGKSAQEHIAKPQTGLYVLLCALNDLPSNVISIEAFNPRNNKATVEFALVTEELAEKSYEIAETAASEMHSHFAESGLYDRYGANLWWNK